MKVNEMFLPLMLVSVLALNGCASREARYEDRFDHRQAGYDNGYQDNSYSNGGYSDRHDSHWGNEALKMGAAAAAGAALHKAISDHNIQKQRMASNDNWGRKKYSYYTNEPTRNVWRGNYTPSRSSGWATRSPSRGFSGGRYRPRR